MHKLSNRLLRLGAIIVFISGICLFVAYRSGYFDQQDERPLDVLGSNSLDTIPVITSTDSMSRLLMAGSKSMILVDPSKKLQMKQQQKTTKPVRMSSSKSAVILENSFDWRKLERNNTPMLLLDSGYKSDSNKNRQP